MSFLIKNGKCRVKISFYFFALLCLAAFLDRGGVLLWGLFAALLHEGGHIVAMRLTAEGLPKEIRLTPFGVRIENSPLAETGRGRLGVLAAGSGMNFLCVAVTFGILPSFAAVSLVLGILNLLPVEGMDGGGILLLLLEREKEKKRLSAKAASRLYRIVTTGTLCLTALAGVAVLLATGGNGTLLGVAAALAVRSAGQRRQRRRMI